MKELRRLLRYVRPYWTALLASVLLMACVGAAQAMIAFLIGPIFDRILNPASAEAPVMLFTVPGFGRQIYLDQLVPSWIHNVWTMVAYGILVVFFVKGLCEYLGTYLVNYVGLSAVTNLRQAVFEKVVRQDAEFFETHSTGRLMSSIMNDIDKIQVATSSMLAD